MTDADRDKWNCRYGEQAWVMGERPKAFPLRFEARLRQLRESTCGRALEIACGEGQLSVWLADRGWHVDAVDISTIGLRKLQDLAARSGVDERIRAIEYDLDRGLPDGCESYDLITCLHFWSPVILREAVVKLAPQGLLIAEVLSRIDPSEAAPSRYCAGPGELHAIARDLTIAFYCEGLIHGIGRAQLVAYRGPAPPITFD